MFDDNDDKYLGRALLIIFAVIFLSIFSFRRFTTKKWIKYPKDRLRIIGDFERRYNLIGMDKKEVLKLLGEDNHRESFKVVWGEERKTFKNQNILTYSLGTDFMEEVWYIIVFDKNDKVKKCLCGVT